MWEKIISGCKGQGIIKWLVLISYTFFLYNISYFLEGFSRIGVILTPILYGFVIAYLMNPLIKKIDCLLERTKLEKTRGRISILISYILITVALIGLVLIVVPKVIQSLEVIFQSLPVMVPKWLDSANNMLTSISNTMGIDVIPIETVSDRIGLEISDKYNTEKLILLLVNLTKGVSSLFINMLLGLIISIYMVMNKDMYRGKIKKVIFAYMPEELGNKFIKWWAKVNDTFGDFLVAKLIDSTIIGIMCYIGCMLLGLNNAMLIGLIVGVTNVVPYFGPIIGAIPASIIVLMQGWVGMLIFIVFIFALQQFDGNYLGPKLMGGKLGMNSLLIIIAVITMSGLLGVVGMFIGVPLFALIYMFISDDVHKKLELKGKSTKTDDYI